MKCTSEVERMTRDPLQLLLGVVSVDTLLAALTIGFFWVGVSVMRGLGRPVTYSLSPLGFKKPKSGYLSGITLGLLVGLGMLAMNLLLVGPLSFYVFEELGYSTERSVQAPLIQGLVGWIGERPGLAIPVTVAVVVLFGPAVEELIFRGALFGGLYRLGLFISRRLNGKATGERKEAGQRVSFALSALFSSAIFALAHGEAMSVPVLFVLTIILCTLYRRTGSLLPCLVTHATFNGFTVLIVILSGFGVLPAPI
jgi:membrane protease YdiL (CAAX protease family)